MSKKEEYESMLSKLKELESELSEPEKSQLGLQKPDVKREAKQISDSEARKKYRDVVRKFNGNEKGLENGISFESWLSGGVERLLNDVEISQEAKTTILLSSLGNKVYDEAHARGHLTGTPDDIVKNLSEVYGGNQQIESKTAAFYHITQEEGESISKFFFRLREAGQKLDTLHAKNGSEGFKLGPKLSKQLERV